MKHATPAYVEDEQAPARAPTSTYAAPSRFRAAQERERTLVERARAGEDVRGDILASLQNRLYSLALKYKYCCQHLDVEDLVSAANIAVIERLEGALTKGYPHAFAYLYTTAHTAIIETLRQQGSLIKARPHELISVVSLDQPVDHAGTLLSDLLSTELRLPEPSQEQSDRESPRQAALSQAIDALPELERALVMRHHGLNGAPESLAAIARDLSTLPSLRSPHANITRYYKRALQMLRGALAPLYPHYVTQEDVCEQKHRHHE